MFSKAPAAVKALRLEQLAAISRGEAEFASLLPEQHRYDVHFENLPDWRSAPSR
ncbi:hypothetical protein [Streptomyces sp. SID8377]|uniref:hypothetical protein n=1 Tax=Streptomyces sp. SID8377 TaxID=2690357 RepID=UPI0019256E2E|nr:hypothetical protein [Streptomyces sp. SID8377]